MKEIAENFKANWCYVAKNKKDTIGKIKIELKMQDLNIPMVLTEELTHRLHDAVEKILIKSSIEIKKVEL